MQLAVDEVRAGKRVSCACKQPGDVHLPAGGEVVGHAHWRAHSDRCRDGHIVVRTENRELSLQIGRDTRGQGSRNDDLGETLGRTAKSDRFVVGHSFDDGSGRTECGQLFRPPG